MDYIQKEEKRSTHKFNMCKSFSEVMASQEKNKKECKNRDQLIMKYAYLVNMVVNRLPLSTLNGMDRDDLIGYGTIGLIESVDRFDPSRNSSFESFAILRIKGSIYDQLRSVDMLSRNSRKRVKTLSKTINELENKLGRSPSDSELTEELKISPEELRKIQGESQLGVFSLDEKRDGSEDGAALIESISSSEASVLDEMQENELLNSLTKAIDTLPEREKAVLGLYHYNRLTFKEIAEVMSFSESRASQLHARAISLLKSKMLEK